MKKGYVKNKTNDGITSVRNKDGSLNRRVLNQAILDVKKRWEISEHLRKKKCKLKVFDDGVPLSWETTLFKLSEYGIKVVLK